MTNEEREIYRLGLLADDNSEEYNQLDIHESLDRTFVVNTMLDDFVLSSRFIINNPEEFNMACEISEKLAELYSKISQSIDIKNKDVSE